MGTKCGFTQDENTILWSSFLKDSRYTSESIGIYEGACTYMSGVYRPTEDSMMNTNTCGFNAPSRKAIYDMVMKRGENRETSYEEFTVFDKQNPSESQTSDVIQPLPAVAVSLHAHILSASLSTSKI